ncbi:MAG TPA: amidohydrolase family protein [Victivallales bacterium]|nr:amidohydrolase family protein [Victivallales bacterium]
MSEFKIIDSHTHFLVKGTDIISVKERYVDSFGERKWNILQDKNRYIQKRWSKAFNFPNPNPVEDTIEETASKWLLELEKNNIEKIVFATAGNQATSNENMKRIVSIAPDKFVGYAFMNIFAENAAGELDKALTEYGLKGLKILAPDLEKKLDDKSLYPLWEVAEKHKVPVLIHFGILGGAGGIAKHENISPIILHDIARAFPEVPFIVPHFGCGQTKDLLQVAWVCPNIYIDTSGSNQWVNWMPYKLTVKDLFKKFYETVGPQRILFGTDSMWFPRGFVRRYYEDQLRDCVEIGMTDDEIKMIFNTNIRNLLNI